MPLKPEPTWRATADALNALPHPIRRYIQKLEDQHDPNGNVRELMITTQQLEALQFKFAQIETELKSLKETLKDDSNSR